MHTELKGKVRDTDGYIDKQRESEKWEQEKVKGWTGSFARVLTRKKK